MPQRRVVSESGAAPSLPLPDHTRLPTTPEVDLATAPTSKLTRQPAVLKSSPSQDLSEEVPTSADGVAKWHNLPKDIWKQAAEALDDFGMLKENDRVLVCLSGSSSSLSLLHLLRQFVRARHLTNVTLATVSFGDCGVDPRALMLYLRELKVDYFYEQQETTENLQDKLVAFAGRRNFNVLAMANTLDKLADRFLMSLLYQGKLHTTQAISSATGADRGEPAIRIIRPLLYLRERALEDFAGGVALPSRPSRLFTRPPDVANSILRVQEAANPAVYGNIRSALKPLLAMRVESTKSTYESIRAALVSRD